MNNGRGPGSNQNNGAFNRDFGRWGNNNLSIGNRSISLGRQGYRPSFYNHGFYRGNWNNNNFAWNRPGYYRPIGWGLGGWGLGNLIYSSGYNHYYNPYFAGGGINGGYGGGVYNYSQPIEVVNVGTESDETQQAFASAREAFYAGDYQAALNAVDFAIKRNPNDAVFHEFRGVTLFALQQYRESATVLHSVLAVGPGWDWDTLRSLYPTVEVFTIQLRTLEDYRDANPQRADVRFLLGYLYLTTGYPESAGKQFARVVQLMPEDKLSAQLQAMVSGKTVANAMGEPTNASVLPMPPETGDTPSLAQPQPVTPRPATPGNALDAAKFVGHWNASRGEGSKFDLMLNADGTFQWKFAEGSESDSFSGKYHMEGNTLILEREEGGALVGNVIPNGDNKFNFRLINTDPQDKGLDFSK